MSLLVKMQKALVTFSFALTFKVREYLIFQNIGETRKGYREYKTFEESQEVRKI